MSYNPVEFVGELHKYKRPIKEFGGQTHFNVHIGILKWHWEDDKGKYKNHNPKII